MCFFLFSINKQDVAADISINVKFITVSLKHKPKVAFQDILYERGLYISMVLFFFFGLVFSPENKKKIITITYSRANIYKQQKLSSLQAPSATWLVIIYICIYPLYLTLFGKGSTRIPWWKHNINLGLFPLSFELLRQVSFLHHDLVDILFEKLLRDSVVSLSP